MGAVPGAHAAEREGVAASEVVVAVEHVAAATGVQQGMGEVVQDKEVRVSRASHPASPLHPSVAAPRGAGVVATPIVAATGDPTVLRQAAAVATKHGPALKCVSGNSRSNSNSNSGSNSGSNSYSNSSSNNAPVSTGAVASAESLPESPPGLHHSMEVSGRRTCPRRSHMASTRPTMQRVRAWHRHREAVQAPAVGAGAAGVAEAVLRVVVAEDLVGVVV